MRSLNEFNESKSNEPVYRPVTALEILRGDNSTPELPAAPVSEANVQVEIPTVNPAPKKASALSRLFGCFCSRE